VLRQAEVPTWDSVFAAQVGRYRGEASALG
jgi:hypothetical protein